LNIYDNSSNLYLGPLVMIDSSGNLSMSTADNAPNQTFKLKISPANPKCGFVKTISIPITLGVCGGERVTLVNMDNITFTVVVGSFNEPKFISADEIATWFKTTEPYCGLTTFISREPTGLP